MSKSHLKQLSSFENNMAKEKKNDLVLTSLQMAHVVMKRKCAYTELESVVLLRLEIVADILPGGEKPSQK